MTPTPSDAGDLRLDEDLRRVAAARSRGLEGHPSPQELLDYHFDALPPEEADALQDHLSLCRECAQVVLDLAAFARPDADETPSAALGSEWNRLQERLGRERRETPPRPKSTSKTGRLPWALAASLLMILGLLGWNWKLRELTQPHADVIVAVLSPRTPGMERSPEAPVQVEVPRKRSRVHLRLNLGDLRSFPDYRLELADPNGGVLWEDSDVVRQPDGAFVLDLPVSLVEPKVYTVRLYGQSGGDRVPLAEYSFEVVRGAPPQGQ